MIFDSKCNETGVRYYQKEPKNFGPRSLGQIPVDRQSPKVQLFQTWISPTKSDKIAKIRSLSLLNLKKFVSKSGIIFAIQTCFEGEIGITNGRKSISMLNWKFEMEVRNKPSILLLVGILCHISMLFSRYQHFWISNGSQAIWVLMAKNYLKK